MTSNSGHTSEAGDFTEADDPLALFLTWYREALAHEPSDPNAMALATVDAAGQPNVRMVLWKGPPDGSELNQGFAFYTNLDSAKAHEMRACPKAALLFHWKSLGRQVRLRGRLHAIGDDEADHYFATRPRGSRIGAWASAQSRPLASPAALMAAVAEYEALFAGKDVPRPPGWSGYRLLPFEIEFWQHRPSRLHDRLVFRRAESDDQHWTRTRLYP